MDPLLASLQYGETPVFDLTRGFRTISVRDQMVRAAMVARALPVWLRQRPPGLLREPVLVLGGGACGMTAAVELARQGIAVELVEPHNQPFRVQRACRSRWLDPVQYDWPMDHWTKAAFPWSRPARRRNEVVPFPFEAAPAHRVVERWDRQWDAHRHSECADFLGPRFRWSLLEQPGLDADGNVAAHLYDLETGTDGGGTYAAAILAVGFGAEDCRIAGSPLVGFRFWESDPLEDPTYGGRLPRGRDVVLISGSGDGGLQDLLRVLSRRPSARQIYEDLELARSGLRLNRLFSAEQRLERATAWDPPRPIAGAPYPFTSTPYLDERHEIYRGEVRQILNPDLPNRVVAYLAYRPRQTFLISEHEHFRAHYGLNLLLALLFIESLRLHPNPNVRNSIQIVSPGRVTAVAPAGAPIVAPTDTALDCLGRPWNVTVSGLTRPIPANVVIIRHGLTRTFPAPAHVAPPRSYPRPMPPTHLHP